MEIFNEFETVCPSKKALKKIDKILFDIKSGINIFNFEKIKEEIETILCEDSFGNYKTLYNFETNVFRFSILTIDTRMDYRVNIPI
jgi:hypothetical protein